MKFLKIVKIGTSSCGPCKQLHEVLKTFEADSSNYEVKELDADTDDDADEYISKYNIRTVPVLLVFDENGNLLKKGKPATLTRECLDEWLYDIT